METILKYEDLASMAFSAATPDKYASYLQGILNTANRITAGQGQTVVDITFYLQPTGMVLPFGENY